MDTETIRRLADAADALMHARASTNSGLVDHTIHDALMEVARAILRTAAPPHEDAF